MIPARYLVSAVVLCLAVAPVAHADPVDQLARLIETSSKSGDPTTAFLAGFDALGDFDMNGEQIRAALVKANVSADGPLAPVIGNATRISKKGKTIDIRRSEKTTLDMPEGAAIRLGEHIEFDLTQGFVGTLGSDAAKRLKDARGTYFHMDEIDGIEVRQGGGSFYNLYELYLATENDTQVAHIKAGMWLRKKWIRLEIPSVEADAATESLEVEASAADGLPTPRLSTRSGEVASLTDETPQGARDVFESPLVSDEGLAGFERVDPTPITIIDAPVEDTPILPDPTVGDAPVQITGDKQGLLSSLAQATSQDPAQATEQDSSNEPVLIETPEGLASGAPERTHQSGQPTETVPDKPLEEIIVARRQATETVPQGQPGLDTPIKDLIEGPQVVEVTKDEIEEPVAQRTPEQVTIDLPLGEKAQDEPQTEEIALAPTAVPAEIKLPEAEEKARIDESVEAQTGALDSMGSKLDELIALLKKDPAKANRSASEQLEQLEKQNARLEAMIKAQDEKISQLTQRLDDSRRSLPGDDYRRDRDRDEFRSDSDRFDRDFRRARADRSYDSGRDRDRYYDSRRGDDRVSGPRSDRSRNSRVDRRNRPATTVPITNANNTSVNGNQKQSLFQKLMAAILKGLKQGLAQRYAKATTTNLNNRATLLAGNNPNNLPYANYRIGTAVNNGTLGNTIGNNPWSTSNGVISVPYNNAYGNVVGRVPGQPGYGYQPNGYQPTYRPTAPRTGTYVVPIQPGGGNPLIRR